MKLVNAIGMKREVCASCFEYPENCRGCEFYNCAICDEEITSSETYEYRGVYSCAKHHDEVIEKREEQRERVMEITNKSTESQRNGYFINSSKKSDKYAGDGLPIIKVKEPLALQEYEEGKL